jgi:UDP-N-acetylmuramate dehydrogenase
MSDLYQQLKTFGKVKTNELMSKHTTFQIGGPARFFVIVEETEKLVALLNFLSGEGVDYVVVGAGSNLLFQDEEFNGVIIKLQISNCPDVKYGIPHCHRDRLQNNNVIEANAGTLLASVLDETMKSGFTGMEWAAGVPGTVGGAIRGNAGAYGGSTSDNLLKVEIWENGEVKELTKEECDFNYRGSYFKDNPGAIVLRAWFRFKQGDKAAIIAKVQDYLQRRKSRFPSFPSAGCFFTNIKLDKWPGDKSILLPEFFEIGEVPVGWIIEQVGCKGLRVGGAMVSDQHCNFIINVDNATQADILNLVEQVKEKVYNKFGVELQHEVKIV